MHVSGIVVEGCSPHVIALPEVEGDVSFRRLEYAEHGGFADAVTVGPELELLVGAGNGVVIGFCGQTGGLVSMLDSEERGAAYFWRLGSVRLVGFGGVDGPSPSR